MPTFTVTITEITHSFPGGEKEDKSKQKNLKQDKSTPSISSNGKSGSYQGCMDGKQKGYKKESALLHKNNIAFYRVEAFTFKRHQKKK